MKKKIPKDLTDRKVLCVCQTAVSHTRHYLGGPHRRKQWNGTWVQITAQGGLQASQGPNQKQQFQGFWLGT